MFLFKPFNYLRPGPSTDSSDNSLGLLEGLLAMEKVGVVESFPSGRETSSSPSLPQRRKWWQFGGKDISYVSIDEDLDQKSETSSSDNVSLVRNVDNVFEAPEAAEIYKPIQGFEGAHRFDPSATWTPEEEKVLVRRVSWHQLRKIVAYQILSSTGLSQCRLA